MGKPPGIIFVFGAAIIVAFLWNNNSEKLYESP
jgi:hypothetical protein